MNPAVLALEDGTVFEGRSFGAPAERTGEVVFNTAITGYQEVFTDPSYSGQIVVLTYPQIGNYGTNEGDNEAAKPHIEGLVVREFSPLSSNWRADETAQDFLTNSGVPVISEIDTRRLVRHLRTRGVMRGVLSAAAATRWNLSKRPETARPWPASIWPRASPRRSVTTWTQGVVPCSPSEQMAPRRAALPRGGLRFRHQAQHPAPAGALGCRVTVVPAATTAEDVLALAPDGVFLSNGPGDPEPLHFPGRASAQADRQEAGLRHLPGPPDCWGSRWAARPTS